MAWFLRPVLEDRLPRTRHPPSPFQRAFGGKKPERGLDVDGILIIGDSGACGSNSWGRVVQEGFNCGSTLTRSTECETGDFDACQSFGDRPDLMQLDQDGIGSASAMPFLNSSVKVISRLEYKNLPLL